MTLLDLQEPDAERECSIDPPHRLGSQGSEPLQQPTPIERVQMVEQDHRVDVQTSFAQATVQFGTALVAFPKTPAKLARTYGLGVVPYRAVDEATSVELRLLGDALDQPESVFTQDHVDPPVCRRAAPAAHDPDATHQRCV